MIADISKMALSRIILYEFNGSYMIFMIEHCFAWCVAIKSLLFALVQKNGFVLAHWRRKLLLMQELNITQ